MLHRWDGDVSRLVGSRKQVDLVGEGRKTPRRCRTVTMYVDLDLIVVCLLQFDALSTLDHISRTASALGNSRAGFRMGHR
jgi:hypothetical protein